MARSHVLVQALDRVRTGQVAELLVHVVCTRPRVVAQPDAEVFHLQRLALRNLSRQRKHARRKTQIIGQLRSHSACHLNGYARDMIHTMLTPMTSPLAFLTFFNFLHSFVKTPTTNIIEQVSSAPEEVPETGFCDNFIGREDAHAVDFGGWLTIRGQVAAHDLVFLQRCHL